MDKREQREKRLVISLLIGIILLLGLILFSAIFYIRSSRPMRQARAEAVQLAEQYANMESVDAFYWFTREQTYFSVAGTNDEDRKIIAVIPKSGEKITVLDQNEGISEEEARAIVSKEYPDETIQKVNLGLYEDKAVWEVVTESSNENNYYLVDFKEGAITKAIQNI